MIKDTAASNWFSLGSLALGEVSHHVVTTRKQPMERSRDGTLRPPVNSQHSPAEQVRGHLGSRSPAAPADIWTATS